MNQNFARIQSRENPLEKMPAKTSKLPEDASQKSPTQTGLKKMTRADFVEFITPTRALDDGQVYFSFKKQVSSSIRGVFLLDLEILIKNKIDAGIIIWCEPIGDKNSLRNLRGIEIIA